MLNEKLDEFWSNGHTLLSPFLMKNLTFEQRNICFNVCLMFGFTGFAFHLSQDGEKEIGFKVTRMRCWRISSGVSFIVLFIFIQTRISWLVLHYAVLINQLDLMSFVRLWSRMEVGMDVVGLNWPLNTSWLRINFNGLLFSAPR